MIHDSTIYLGSPDLLDQPAFSKLFAQFNSAKVDPETIFELYAYLSPSAILQALPALLLHEMSHIDRVGDRQYRAINPGSLTLLGGPNGSLAVRNIEASAKQSVSITLPTDIVVFHLAGSEVTTTTFSVDHDQNLSEFNSSASISQSSTVVLDGWARKRVFARAGYDAVIYECVSPSLLAEIRFGAPSCYNWVFNVGTLRPLRMLVQDATLNHHEMMISYLAQCPAQQPFIDAVLPYCSSTSHFVRWAAYKYLMRFSSEREKVLDMGCRDSHPHVRSTFDAIRIRAGCKSLP